MYFEKIVLCQFFYSLKGDKPDRGTSVFLMWAYGESSVNLSALMQSYKIQLDITRSTFLIGEAQNRRLKTLLRSFYINFVNMKKIL